LGTAGALTTEQPIGTVVGVTEILRPEATEPTDWSADEVPPPSTQGGLWCQDEALLSRRRAQNLHDTTGALVTAWESSAGLYVAREHHKAYYEVRGVTDHCQASTPRDVSDHLPQVMAELVRWANVSLGDA
jgi:hypothetical protein